MSAAADFAYFLLCNQREEDPPLHEGDLSSDVQALDEEPVLRDSA
jgi:hypothetical protein